MKFAFTNDRILAEKVVTHPNIWPHVSDDYSGKPESFEASGTQPIFYVEVREADTLLGLFILTLENTICWKIHTCLLPEAWGEKAKLIGNDLRDWIFSKTICRRIVTDVPAHNRLALKFAKACGMTEYGINPASFMKHGKLHDQILLGVSKCQ